MARRAAQPVPSGLTNLTAHLWFSGNCRAAIDVYTRVFDAVELMRLDSPDATAILHALLRIGEAPLMLADAWPGGWERGPRDGTSVGIWLYVEDCDAVFERAAVAGFEVMMPLADAFWGDRFGKAKDPFGHVWSIATHQWELSPEEMAEAQAAWRASL